MRGRKGSGATGGAHSVAGKHRAPSLPTAPNGRQVVAAASGLLTVRRHALPSAYAGERRRPTRALTPNSPGLLVLGDLSSRLTRPSPPGHSHSV